jgi:hypothetical protein
MPLPVPSPREEENEFIRRCMADPITGEEFPDASQRAAVCQSQWARQLSKSIVQKNKNLEYGNKKISKPDAGYRCPAAKLEVRCGTCAYFDGKDSCAEVAGKISENCVSDNWKPRQ